MALPVGLGALLLVLVAGGIWIVMNRSDGSSSGAARTTPASVGPGTVPSFPPTSESVSSPSATVPGSTATPDATEIAQAQHIRALLDRSTVARTGVQASIDAVSNCGDIPTAIGTLSQAATVRNQLVVELRTTDVSAIPNGTVLASGLQTAFLESAAADTAYANWGRDVLGACSGRAPADDQSRAAGIHDSNATNAKRLFAGQWNSFAPAIGLPAIDPNAI